MGTPIAGFVCRYWNCILFYSNCLDVQCSCNRECNAACIAIPGPFAECAALPFSNGVYSLLNSIYEQDLFGPYRQG